MSFVGCILQFIVYFLSAYFWTSRVLRAEASESCRLEGLVKSRSWLRQLSLVHRNWRCLAATETPPLDSHLHQVSMFYPKHVSSHTKKKKKSKDRDRSKDKEMKRKDKKKKAYKKREKEAKKGRLTLRKLNI